MRGTINIVGDIGLKDGDIFLIDVISQVKRQPEATSFTLNITSPGGSLEEGILINNYLKSLGVPIHSVGRGVVASVATIIFLAGDTREVTEGSRFMIHTPLFPEIKNANSYDLDMYATMLREGEAQLVKFYKDCTSLDNATISSMLKNETYLSPQQLYDLGFTTTATPAKLQAVAKLNLKTNEMKDAKKDTAKTILSMIANFLSGKGIQNKLLLTADQAELNFPDVEEDQEITVGSSATLDGQPAQGEITVSDGRIFVFEAGVLLEIKEAATEEVEELKEEITKLEAELEEAITAKATIAKERDDAVKIINKIKEIQSKAVGDQPKDNPKQVAKSTRPFAAAIANLKTQDK